MCGIAGVVSSAPKESTIRRMCGAIAHRGPDDEGVWLSSEEGVALGNRRLAIVDVSSAGHQPMQSSDGRFVLTFNGEIYNHRELRARLEQAGSAPASGWRGHCDTETLVEAIAVWGLEKAIEQSVGMFAFAVWDRRHRRLHLVRDRFGEKPLYYSWIGKDFVFASELKAIRAHPRFEAEVDRRAVAALAARNYIPAPLSIYRNISKLQAACILTLDRSLARTGQGASGVSISPFWSYAKVVMDGLRDPIDSEQEALHELDRALAQSIRHQSQADVPVGAFLSGGVDSSTIVAQYQKHSSRPVSTFTIGFEDPAFNEADHARAVARHLGTDHHQQIVTMNDARDVIPKLPAIYDEPFGDSSQIATYLVSAFARRHVKVALSGDGGDELFGGYNRYFGTAAVWSGLQRLPKPLRAAALRVLASVPSSLWTRALSFAATERSAPYVGQKVAKALRAMSRANDLGPLFAALLDEWSEERSPALGAEGPEFLPIELGGDVPDAVRMMHCDAVSYLPGDILCKIDRASMAVGLEAHVPFLDHRVAEVAARISPALKMGSGSGKRILRELLYRDVPRELIERPKQGFAVPVGEWIKGPLRPWAEELLDGRRLAADGWFDREAVGRRWRDHVAGKRDGSSALWSILMFQAWLRAEENVVRAAA